MFGLILKILGLICWFMAAFATIIGVTVTRVDLIALGALLFFLPEVLPL